MQRTLAAIKADTTLPVSLLGQFDLSSSTFWNELLGSNLDTLRKALVHHREVTLASASDPLLKFCDTVGVVVHPSLTLRRGGQGSEEGICWSALKDIAAGESLLSVPSYVAVDSSCAGDPLEDYFPVLEHLASQLVLRRDFPLWQPYIRELRSVRNMPYLSSSHLVTPDAKDVLQACFEVLENPLTDVLQNVDRETHQWALSIALSRRCGAFLLPMADFVNHKAPMPNAHATMPNVYDITVADAIDNYLAGCDVEALTTAHYHLYSIRPIRAGETVGTSYTDLSPLDAAGQDVWRSVWGFVPTEGPQNLTQRQLSQAVSSLARCRVARLSS